MHEYLQSLEIKVFKTKENREKFIQLFLEKTRLERELYNVQKELEKFKQMNEEL